MDVQGSQSREQVLAILNCHQTIQAQCELSIAKAHQYSPVLQDTYRSVPHARVSNVGCG